MHYAQAAGVISNPTRWAPALEDEAAAEACALLDAGADAAEDDGGDDAFTDSNGPSALLAQLMTPWSKVT